MLAQAIYTPQPKAADLLAARTDEPTSVAIDIEYCVKDYGKTSKIAVIGDDDYPAYSAIVIKTVAKWRFKPFMLGGKIIEACSSQRFTIEITP